MKVAVCSDLHLEFGMVELDNEAGADVLVLSGDVLVAVDLNDPVKAAPLHRFFEHVTTLYPAVVYVAGNHEHYHGDFAHTLPLLHQHLGRYANLHILERSTVEFDGVVFAGSTLWTDMNKGNPLTLEQMRLAMNEFVCVRNSNVMVQRRVPLYETVDGVTHVSRMGVSSKPALFKPEDAAEEFALNLKFLADAYTNLAPGKRMVVVGHHTPSYLSSNPRYSAQYHMNAGYHSELAEFIFDRPRVALWTHGHTHDPYDYMLGSTRVVCNPRGYFGHEDVSNFKMKVVEV